MGFAPASAPAAADDTAGAAAFARGDFAHAETEWAPAADKGDPEAEFGLGEVYEQGKGDYRGADRWYGKAAEQGNAAAEYRLMLIWLAGNTQFPPDLAKAYGWMLIASHDGYSSDTLGQLRRDLEAHVSDAARAEGQKFAAAWKTERNPPPPTPQPGQTPSASALLPPPAPAPDVSPAAPPSAAPPTPSQVMGLSPSSGQVATPAPASSISAPSPTPAGEQTAAIPVVPPPNPRAELNAALKGIECAAVHIGTSSDGTLAVSGNVPDEQSRAKLTTIAANLPPDQQPRLHVDIIPPPLCGSIIKIDDLMRAGIAAAGGIETSLVSGDEVLHPGQSIQVAVKSLANYALNLRIDYFTLDNQVLHMWPNRDLPAAQLIAAGQTKQLVDKDRKGGTWQVGAAPFGTELIVAIATPRPLNLGASRPPVERAETYLRDLITALPPAHVGGQQSFVATTFIHTAP